MTSLKSLSKGRWNEEKSRKDKSGKRWNFSYWHSWTFPKKSREGQRLFFWDDRLEFCGVVLFLPGATVPYSRVRDVIAKLIAHESVRKRYQRKLLFPLEKHYSEYGAFPEEISSLDPD